MTTDKGHANTASASPGSEFAIQNQGEAGKAFASPLPWVIFFALTLAAFVTALVPINSNDIWWHLKTGDYIRSIGALPVTDPFSYLPATDSVEPGRPQMILRQYWLAQVLYSLGHEFFGLAGIVCLRALLCAGMVLAPAVFIWRATRSYMALLPTLPLILALRVILEDSDRPHLFVFATTLLVVLVLESCARTGKRRPLYLLPPAQLLMAQVHPGFAVGTLILLIYAVAALWEDRLRLLRRPLWIAAGLSLLFFFLNPNGHQLVTALLGISSSMAAGITLEFQSPLAIWRHVLAEPGWLAFWVLSSLALPTIGLLLQRRCWSSTLALSGLSLAALFSMRYIGFFLPVAAVVVGLEIGRLVSGRILAWGRCALAGGLLTIALVLMIFPGHPNRGRIYQLLQPGYFPVRAAGFLDGHDAPGNLFNFDAWGGYLEYRLWPRQKVFIDTRLLTNDAILAYREIVAATPAGLELLTRHGINTVIFPPLDIYGGQVYPLVRRLSDDPQWSLVHFDDTALIFARQPHPLPALAKEMIWFQVLRQVEAWQPRFPWVPGYQRTRDEATARMRGNR